MSLLSLFLALLLHLRLSPLAAKRFSFAKMLQEGISRMAHSAQTLAVRLRGKRKIIQLCCLDQGDGEVKGAFNNACSDKSGTVMVNTHACS
ncbi:hypothetical protein MCOR14_004797 [Pyricularia oryzae]|nr:hypothetical protein MCOR34_000904 [Pyricularia oryzae]KAI6580722.1 hypothetical protein MCOR04_005623 [Pyricularia oryzae]KAI6637462.1 hypothetical protein MCOR14_004797 [Pyricularia oryzae]